MQVMQVAFVCIDIDRSFSDARCSDVVGWLVTLVYCDEVHPNGCMDGLIAPDGLGLS